MRVNVLRNWSLIAALLGASLLATATQARDRRGKQPDFWEELANPGRKQLQRALKQGRGAYVRAMNIRRTTAPMRARSGGVWNARIRRMEREATSLLERAVKAYGRAARAVPGDATARYLRGQALYELQRYKQAHAAYVKARRLDPGRYGKHSTLSFNVALCLTKMGRFEQAVDEYDRTDRILAAQASGSLRGNNRVRSARSLNHANAAELLMASGRLDASIQRFHEALNMAPSGYRTRRKQAYWGLAVAYDRDEQVNRALSYARMAVKGDPRMRYLLQPGTFFVPEGEIHYFFAMGHLGQGNVVGAQRQFKLYLEKLPRGMWAPRAVTHLNQLSAGKAPGKGGKVRYLAPAPGSTGGDPSQRDRVFASHRLRSYLRPIIRCYEQVLRRQPNISGRLKVALVVKRDGRVRTARVAYSTLGHAGLHRCVLGVLKGARFNRLVSGSRTLKLNYSFQFTPTN